MQTMGLSYQKTRPSHPKADPKARERFEKASSTVVQDALFLPLSDEDVETATVAQTVRADGLLQMKTEIRSAAAVEHKRQPEDKDQTLPTRLKRAFAIVRGMR